MCGLSLDESGAQCVRVAVRFKWGFGEGRLKDKFAFFEAYANPIPKRRKLLAKRPCYKQKGTC